MCGLVLQILQTRIFSVITWYHLAFFAISMAMFGMTAGSLFVYFRHHLFPPQQLFERLAQICMAFSLSAVASILLMLSTVVIETSATMMTVLLWLKLILIIVPPYVFAGMAISLALTRSPFPIGLVYAVDLAGAAMGCLAILALLNLVDGVSAMIAVGALGALAAACFAAAHQLQEQPSRSPSQPKRPSVLRRSLAVAAILTSLAAGNAWLQPRDGLALTIAKGEIERPDRVAAMRWNSFSRIKTTPSAAGAPAMWGASAAMPPTTLNQRMLNIDGSAGTSMYQFDGDIRVLDFLKYDVTNLAYYIRNHGRAAVIGVGGGRDVLSAYVFGFRDVTGVELNPIFVDFLEKDFHDYNRLTDLPGVHLNVDEARSWFARTTDRFDLVQMSMIDTWAATGAGAFSLSENGLYTIQGWARFLDRLTPSGVFTVSRWYAPNNVNETGRLVSLAKAALLELGIRDPAKQMFLVGHKWLSTLIVGRSPFTTEDIASLKQASARLGYHVLVSPDAPVTAPLLHEIMAAPDLAALDALAGRYHLDVSPPTDERPFFFNQLRMSDPVSMLQALHAGTSVSRGNSDGHTDAGPDRRPVGATRAVHYPHPVVARSPAGRAGRCRVRDPVLSAHWPGLHVCRDRPDPAALDFPRPSGLRPRYRPLRHHPLDWAGQLSVRASAPRSATAAHCLGRGASHLSRRAAFVVPVSYRVFRGC